MNNKGKAYGVGTIAIVVVLVLAAGFLLFGGQLPALGLSIPSGGQITMPKAVQTSCDSTTSPELRLVALDEINQGTLRTDNFDANVYINGTYNSGYHLATDSTVDVTAGDGYTVWFKQSGGNTTYFGYLAQGNAQCQELETINAKIATVGTMTLTAKNTDDDLLNAVADNQAIGAGESVGISFKIKESTQDACLGSPHSTKDLMICADYNSGAFKVPIIKLNGANLPVADTPPGHTNLRASRNDNTACFIMTGTKAICDFTEIPGFVLNLEAKASSDPGTENSADLNIHLYMPQVYQQGDTGVFDWVYSNTYDANAIILPTTTPIYIS